MHFTASSVQIECQHLHKTFGRRMNLWICSNLQNFSVHKTHVPKEHLRWRLGFSPCETMATSATNLCESLFDQFFWGGAEIYIWHQQKKFGSKSSLWFIRIYFWHFENMWTEKMLHSTSYHGAHTCVCVCAHNTTINTIYVIHSNSLLFSLLNTSTPPYKIEFIYCPPNLGCSFMSLANDCCSLQSAYTYRFKKCHNCLERKSSTSTRFFSTSLIAHLLSLTVRLGTQVGYFLLQIKYFLYLTPPKKHSACLSRETFSWESLPRCFQANTNHLNQLSSLFWFPVWTANHGRGTLQCKIRILYSNTSIRTHTLQVHCTIIYMYTYKHMYTYGSSQPIYQQSPCRRAVTGFYKYSACCIIFVFPELLGIHRYLKRWKLPRKFVADKLRDQVPGLSILQVLPTVKIWMTGQNNKPANFGNDNFPKETLVVVTYCLLDFNIPSNVEFWVANWHPWSTKKRGLQKCLDLYLIM